MLPVPPATVLLPPAAVPVSAEARLTYVLRHFRLMYAGVPDVGIGAEGTPAAITIADSAGSFFQQHTPYPDAPHWREWAGQRVPFFFDGHPAAELLELRPGQAHIGADIISAAFYLLSGWQEYFSDTRDWHGRFPYAASVQQRFGFVALPVVNYYFDLLRTAVEHVSGRPLRARQWRAGAPFAAFISHDIDRLHSAWKAPAKAALQRGRLLKFGLLLGQRLGRPDAWNNLEAVAATTAAYGARSTFFMLTEPRSAPNGTPNSDYGVSPPLLRRLRELEAKGSEIGVHSSIGTDTNAGQLRQEAVRLQRCPTGLRFHYLRWEPRLTPAVVDAVGGFSYDSTLGFAEHFGFRHSYCHPFYPYNFATGAEHNFLEIPLNVMDATLHHPNYLQLAAHDIVPPLRLLFAEVEKFGGVVSLLWHNNHFDPTNTVTGPQQFAELMHLLQQRGAAFLNGLEICQQLSASIPRSLPPYPPSPLP